MSKNLKFDRQEVVQKATDLYWQKGFHGTSMRNLQDVIDMRPGSIYATFGSKEGLYKESIQCYADRGLKTLASCYETTGSPLKALKKFVTMSIINSAESGPSGMCMLAKTISELTDDNQPLLDEARRLLNVMENAFTDMLIKAQDCGEINSSEDPKAVARYIQVQLMGLRTYMRANNNDVQQIEELIDNIFDKGIL